MTTEPNQSEAAVDTEDTTLRQQTAEELLGPIQWRSDVKGHFPCPGVEWHTHDSSPEAVVFLDGAPTISCFHQSCAALVEEANRQLRSRIGRRESGRPVRQQGLPLTQEQIERRILVQKLERVAAEWDHWFWTSIGQPVLPWDLCRLSPTTLPDKIYHDSGQFLHLFHPEDCVWFGELDESKFCNVSSLVEDRRFRAPFITPSTFRPGTQHRRNADVLCRRFLVVESDEMSLSQQAALLLALGDKWPLAAVVATGGKSLHGWFRWREEWDSTLGLRVLKAQLQALHCDTAAIKPSQPYRCPGVLNRKTGRFQALLYLNLANSYAQL